MFFALNTSSPGLHMSPPLIDEAVQHLPASPNPKGRRTLSKIIVDSLRDF